MITQKKVTELFEVKRNTLGLWKTTKPNLYNYLINYDGKNDRYRKLNILLQKYIKTAPTNIFTMEQIVYILDTNPKLDITFDPTDIHLYFLNQVQKKFKDITEYTFDISTKLASLNLIEKYIFCERLVDIQPKIKQRKDEKEDLIKHYFKEFITTS